MRSVIAIPGQILPPQAIRSWGEETVVVPTAYLRALRRAGGQEAILHPRPVGDGEAEELVSRFDGLILIGGADVDPGLYGEERHPKTYGVNRDQDAFEIVLIRAAVEARVPTLAICRGIQVLNVALGGSLHQHIPDDPALANHGVPAEPGYPPHPIRIEPGSLVAKAMGTDRADAPSSHHQAIARLARGLVPVGWTEDGLIEAVEMEHGWVVGVQWHPEQAADRDPAHQGLFDALVEQAAAPPDRAG